MIKKPVLTVLGAIAVVLGAVWAGQGIGWLPGSSMTGDPTWLVIGLVALVAGAVLLYLSTRGRSWRNPNGPSGQF
ncbi:hypothetical protein [Ruania halotolerans]|uniref:hypothetical protein n=1 Tax=Ruania halotolerans TaxID=2897773 RepID=UPI001E59A468|nr:hypothetical protein [Ruania halotolerans]UFU07919.1 hypothetical protein LQF10_07430 [Ruania halotolerans]